MQTVRRTLKWGKLVPAVCGALMAVFLFTVFVMPMTPFAVLVGVFAIAAGAVTAVAYFLGQRIHFMRMLACVVLACVGVWAVISCTDFSYSVLILGLGILFVLRAIEEAIAAYAERAVRAKCAFHALYAAIFLIVGILMIVQFFVYIFPTIGAAILTAAALMLLWSVIDGVMLGREGIFSEEVLTYRKAEQEEQK